MVHAIERLPSILIFLEKCSKLNLLSDLSMTLNINLSFT